MKRQLTAVLMVAALLLTATAFGQRHSPSTWRSIYMGQVGPETIMLDLILGPGEFAFARMTIGSAPGVLDGVGASQTENDELWLQFREPEFSSSVSTAADIAFYRTSEMAETVEEGQIDNERLPLLATLTGARNVTWEDDGRSIDVTLTFIQAVGTSDSPVLEPLTGTLDRVAQYAYSTLQQGRIDVGYAYPRFTWDTSVLNPLLETEAAQRQTQWVEEGRQVIESGEGIGWGWTHHENIDLVGWAGDYRSLLRSLSYYTGGAHPNYHSESMLYRIDGHEVTELDLAGLFATEANWLDTLSDLLIEDLRNQDAAWVVDGTIQAFGVEHLMNFTLGPSGLSLHFAPYDVGPYAQGEFVSTVGYDTLLPLAARGGAIEEFARAYSER